MRQKTRKQCITSSELKKGMHTLNALAAGILQLARIRSRKYTIAVRESWCWCRSVHMCILLCIGARRSRVESQRSHTCLTRSEIEKYSETLLKTMKIVAFIFKFETSENAIEHMHAACVRDGDKTHI